MKPKLVLVILIIFVVDKLSSQELVPFQHSNSLWGFRHNAFRNVVIAPKYNFVYSFSDGLAGVGKINALKQLTFGFIN